MDATRADHLSAYGYSRATTPNLVRLAKRGVLFRNAMANSSWTHPSVPTILTSLYPSTHQVNLVASGLHPSIPTLPQVLKQGGVATAVFSANTFISPLFGFGRGVDLFVYSQPSWFLQLMLGHILEKFLPKMKQALQRVEWRLNPQASTAAEDTSARALNRAFLAWAKQTLPQRFFAYFHYMEPHAPYQPSERSKALFVSEPVEEGLGERAFVVHGILPFQRGEPVSPAQRQQIIGLYDAEIRDLDAALGELFAGLRELGIEEQTLVIVTADHGEEFFDHGGWGHGHSLHQELLHVPFILSFPARLPGGQVVDTRVSHVDLMPTILELCGIRTTLPLEGRSLLPLMEHPSAPVEDEVVYSEVYHGGASARALIRGRYKLIAADSGSERDVALYDIQDDPTETRNLAAQKPAVVSSLQAELSQRANAAAGRSRGVVTAKLDDATRSQLRALGYLQ